MTPPRLSHLALDDLEEILQGVAEASGWDHSMRVEERIFARIDLVNENPGIGHRRPDLTTGDLYFIAEDPYLIVYERHTSPLSIHAILHASRDVKRILRSRSN
jgi:plasmid stabilization system protein ParE